MSQPSQSPLLETWEKAYNSIPHDVLNNILVKETLKYELLHPIPSTATIQTIQTISITYLTNRIVEELKKFQEGGIDNGLLEDTIWLDNAITKRFLMKDTQTILYNTIEQSDCDNRDLIWFLDNFVKYIRKILPQTENISIRHKIIDDDDNEIGWVLLIIEQ